MIYILPKRLPVIYNYLYCASMKASTVAHERKVFILLDPAQPSFINAVLMLYG